MTDLATRLRALADETTTDGTVWYRDAVDALRVAADRIQTLEWHLNDRTEGAQLIAAERDALTAKLAGAEKLGERSIKKWSEASGGGVSKVWIVTSGSYSDYSIDRVFTTKAQAEWWINRDPYYGIEEFDLDDVADRCEPCVDVQLVLDTGDVASACTRPGWAGCQREVVVRRDLVGRVVLQVSVRTGDTLDAVKVASEKRAQLIAQSHGLPGLGYYDRDTLTKLR